MTLANDSAFTAYVTTREKHTVYVKNRRQTMTVSTDHGYVYAILNAQGHFVYTGSSLVLAPNDRMSKQRPDV